MKVSIVLPTANQRPARLLRAVESVLDQRTTADDDLDLVVVNNAEAPLPASVAKLLESRGQRHLTATARAGVSYARNRGAEVARHARIAMLDDDDWWQPDFLQRMDAALTRHGADLVWCGSWQWGFDGRRRPFRAPAPVDSVAASLREHPGFGGSNFLVRRGPYLSVGGFDETLFSSNDIDFFNRLLLAGRVLQPLPERLVNVDQTTYPRLSMPHPEKERSNRIFFARYQAYMSPEVRAHHVFTQKLVVALRRGPTSRLGRLLELYPEHADLIRRWQRRHRERVAANT